MTDASNEKLPGSYLFAREVGYFRRWNHSTNHITVSPIEKLKAPPEILVSSTRYFCRQCGTSIFLAAAIVLMCVPVLVQTLKLTVNAALDLTP